MLTSTNLEKLMDEAKPLLHKEEVVQLTKNQKKMIEAMKNNDRLIVATGRQLGTTTALAIYLSDYLLNNPNRKVLISGPALQNSCHTLDKVREMLRLKIDTTKLKVNNKTEITLSNGSNIKVLTLYKGGFDMFNEPDINVNVESAFLTKSQSFGLLEAMVRRALNNKSRGGDGKIFLISTFNPRPEDDLFFQPTYLNSLKGENDFKPIRLTWKNDHTWNEDRYKKIADHMRLLSAENIITEMDVYPIIRPEEE